MRLPWPALAAGSVAVAVGAAGLIYAAVPQSTAAPSSSGPGAVTVADAYVRAPIPPNLNEASAYFTAYNTTSHPDRIIGVQTGAGAVSMLHTSAGGHMRMLMQGVTVPAHGKLVLQAGGKHVMIQGLIGRLEPGQHVDIEVIFAKAGPVDTRAPVIAYGAPVPHSGGH